MMPTSKLTNILSLLIFLFANTAYSKDPVCGIATGFPPYQFHSNGTVTGFDAEVVRLIFDRLNEPFVFEQDDWDEVVNKLRFGKIDLVTGMEINEIRKNFFDFTTAYYHRYDVVFVRKDDTATQTTEDLYNKIITGDRHSFVETYWQKKGIRNKIRIKQIKSKEQSMRLLYESKTKAAIMPKSVGLYLAKQMDFEVRILANPDPGSPVAIAVKKGNRELLTKIDTMLQELIGQGEIDRLYKKWF
ncbi:transporter substrate-binding domain-containing protein [Desulfosarcina ovata]|uniref:transporter substrate-binding domain-containing protein n=1 Tax=Desulfosarcina ovata TaxID=83564 RepID=UPI0012D33718|nr:transporter substrate-binding domain-containing protein [Desulfosarcina ovata]